MATNIPKTIAEDSKLTRSEESFVDKLLMNDPADVEVAPLNIGLQPVNT